ncbi:unnamed protein product [Periconia digitata]|uniref:Uncharacterized protein n=1 Tax=Periconia digitata TaxID=1303443 RepID=A0A9W4U5S1_9PLEO|nr:unnamed protein product [Periconia digitata]
MMITRNLEHISRILICGEEPQLQLDINASAMMICVIPNIASMHKSLIAHPPVP